MLLQTSKKRAIETTDVTRSFGWDSSEGMTSLHMFQLKFYIKELDKECLLSNWMNTVQFRTLVLHYDSL